MYYATASKITYIQHMYGLLLNIMHIYTYIFLFKLNLPGKVLILDLEVKPTV